MMVMKSRFSHRLPEADVRIEVTASAFSPWQLLQAYEQRHAEHKGQYGATAVFIGTMRDFNDDLSVNKMYLEHYPGMTEIFLTDLATKAQQQWDLLDVMIIHRIGEVTPGDTIVLVATWSAHRAHAYEANRHLMEELKSRAPFWKKETLADGGSRWVEKNTAGRIE